MVWTSRYSFVGGCYYAVFLGEVALDFSEVCWVEAVGVGAL